MTTPNAILEALAEEAEKELSGMPSEPDILAGNGCLRFDFPYGLCLTVRSGDEKQFLLQVAWQSTEPEPNLRMTPEGSHKTEASRAGVMGRLQEASSCRNPAALLPREEREDIRETAWDKLQRGWELSRWEKLVFAKNLLDRALPNR